MRIDIRMNSSSSNLFVPFSYNQFIHAMILDKIRYADKEYAAEIHDSRNFKFFTFSEIFDSDRTHRPKIDKERQGIVFEGQTRIFVSSPREQFLKAFYTGLLCKPEIRICNADFNVESTSTLKTPNFSSGQIILRTLTPIVSSTKREIDGKLRTWDLMPEDAQFYNNVRNNLVRKYTEFYGKSPVNNDLSLRIIKPLRTKRIRVKDEFHTGSLMIFEAFGSPELLEFGYECGFGERNSMGFGMVEVTK